VRLKFGCDAAWTTRVTVAVCERLPLVAVISGCDVAVGVFDPVLMASRARSTPGGRTFDFVPSLSCQVADAPLGSRLAFRVTDPLNPFSLFTVTM
jgi:hypothetical protein